VTDNPDPTTWLKLADQVSRRCPFVSYDSRNRTPKPVRVSPEVVLYLKEFDNLGSSGARWTPQHPR
jgi:hypothetical protein